MKEATQLEINEWEIEHFPRIVKWVKDYEVGTISFTLDDVKNGEIVTFLIK